MRIKSVRFYKEDGKKLVWIELNGGHVVIGNPVTLAPMLEFKTKKATPKVAG